MKYEIKDGILLRFNGRGIADIPDNVTGIKGDAFRNASVSEITIPASAESIEEEFYTVKSGGITVRGDNAHFSSSEGVLYNKDKTVLLRYPALKEAESFTSQCVRTWKRSVSRPVSQTQAVPCSITAGN